MLSVADTVTGVIRMKPGSCETGETGETGETDETGETSETRKARFDKNNRRGGVNPRPLRRIIKIVV
jgi:hypothetical protein